MDDPFYRARTLYVEDFNLGRASILLIWKPHFYLTNVTVLPSFYQVLRFTSVKSTAAEWFFRESFSIILSSSEYLSFLQRLNRTVQRPKNDPSP